jgi:putative flavoprotein involved in K+ transport
MDIASPHGRVSTWLAQFSDALEKGDVEAAKALFGDTCYWRDLVAFTWNIKTMEGRDAIGDMLTAQLGHAHPKDWTIEGESPTPTARRRRGCASRPTRFMGSAICGWPATRR